jgi:hypothetical protein
MRQLSARTILIVSLVSVVTLALILLWNRILPGDTPVINRFSVSPGETARVGDHVTVSWDAPADQRVLRVLYHSNDGEVLMGDTFTPDLSLGSAQVTIADFHPEIVSVEFALQAISTVDSSGETVIATYSILIPLDQSDE